MGIWCGTLIESRLQANIPVVVHGYDYPIPDGRGYLGGRGPLPGPWSQPGYNEKGHGDLITNAGLVNESIDEFNNMLQGLTTVDSFAHLHYLELRGTLDPTLTNDAYQEDWGNELHPTNDGFEKVADKFADLINQL